MSKYTTQKASAKATIVAKGKSMVLTRLGTQVDPITQAPTDFAQNHTIFALKLPVSKSGLPDVTRLPETLKDKKLAKLLIAGSGMTIEPQPGDTVLTGVAGEPAWTVYGSTPLDPDASGAIIHNTIIFQ